MTKASEPTGVRHSAAHGLQVINEMETALKAEGGANALQRIVALSSELRDHAHAKPIEEGEKARALAVLKSAKVRALSEQDAYGYIAKLDRLEADIERVACKS